MCFSSPKVPHERANVSKIHIFQHYSIIKLGVTSPQVIYRNNVKESNKQNKHLLNVNYLLKELKAEIRFYFSLK